LSIKYEAIDVQYVVSVKANKKCSFIQISIKETLYCSISVKLIKTKEIVVTPLLLSIIFSAVLISNSINNQQIIAQQQQSPEEIENEILRGQLDIESIDNATTATTGSSVQSLASGNLTVSGIRTQYPDGWEIIIQNTSSSSLSLRFNSPLENDTDIFRENVVLAINTISNNTALSNLTSAALTSYLELYPDLKVIELSSTNLTNNAIPAYKLVASRSEDGLDFMQIFAIKEDKVYSIIYSSERSRYSTYLPIVERMINSLEET
jgi:hypothetical protein